MKRDFIDCKKYFHFGCLQSSYILLLSCSIECDISTSLSRQPLLQNVMAQMIFFYNSRELLIVNVVHFNRWDLPILGVMQLITPCIWM